MRVAEFANFITEREHIRILKEGGAPHPWTLDPILQSYRFCNVRREHDSVTKWVAKHWRNPHNAHEDLWFAMMVSRLFNWPETLTDIGFPLPFDSAYIRRMYRVLAKRVAARQKIWTGAYMISTNGQTVKFKHDYVIENVLKPAWRNRASIRPQGGDTLASFFERLCTLEGMGSFMAGQVIADLKYAAGSPLFLATDWDTWATPGPGSRRGLNRVMERELHAPWPRDTFLKTLLTVRTALFDELAKRRATLPLHAQDVQNCLCEFDKYERVRLGEGRPRAFYNGQGDV